MAKKRKPAQARASGRTSEPIDWQGKPPMIYTLGEDLEESRRLQAALAALRLKYQREATTADQALTT